MSNEDEHFAARLRALTPPPAPSAGFDAALERRLARPRWARGWVAAGALAAAAAAVVAVVALRPTQHLEVVAPAVPQAALDDEFFAALELEAEEEEWLPEDYAGLAEVLDL